LKIQRLRRGGLVIWNGPGLARKRSATPQGIEGVIKPPHRTSDSNACSTNRVINKIHGAAKDPPQPYVPGTVVLDVLANVPPLEIGGGIRQAGGLAHIDTVCVRSVCASRTGPDIGFCTGRRTRRARTRRRGIIRRGACFLRTPPEWFQPGILPKEKATSLTTTVGASVTARLKVNAVVNPPAANRKHCVARLVGSFIDLKFVTTE